MDKLERNRTITVRISDEEHKEIMEKSKEFLMKPSEYVRYKTIVQDKMARAREQQ